ncbi:ATP-binding protein [Bacillaceae bacterium CLA-AA-H227]|uniref:ATP-binding protein n=1 Tax=Robertmurraya yapensis (ex Hitch et al 2024) TaxID=3133160 RepID=A0ACC6SEG2_9BACI
MGRFFSKFKKSTETKYIELPSPSTDISYAELIYKTNRGFLAKKLGQYLNQDSLDWDTLFYMSLSTTTYQSIDGLNQPEMILYLAEQMLAWDKKQKDIVKEIKNLNIHMNFQNAMLKAYEIHQKDLFSSPSSKQENEVTKADNVEWRIYRDVIFAASQGKFLLISEEELVQYKTGIVICEGFIKESSDIPKNRNLAKERLEQRELSKAKMMSWLLVLSEAITNTIKHAEEGKMTLFENEETNEIRFVIEDKGPGFPLEQLPKKVLLAGYSTKKSMGQGFTLMMKMAKQIFLYTSSSGSTIILTFDTWEDKEGQLSAIN